MSRSGQCPPRAYLSISQMKDWLLGVWYRERAGKAILLPLSGLFRLLVSLRRTLYRRGVLRSYRLPVPVVVVGNLSVGGTGKTPLVLWLARTLKHLGLRPGIVSRGYGGKARSWPQTVTADSDPTLVGDEPVVLAARSGCPVVVGPDRVGAAMRLLKRDVDLILSDDGLQHYRLMRDVEVVVVDATRGLGNRACLPAGPLREPVARLGSVDYVVINGEGLLPDGCLNAEVPVLQMRMAAGPVLPLLGGEARTLGDFSGEKVHALAGIGNPDRFFTLLAGAGIDYIPHPHPDHARLTASDVNFADGQPVLMTEKDAVKCVSFATEACWCVRVEASFMCGPVDGLLSRIRSATGEEQVDGALDDSERFS